jgi:hypothetical protein
LREQLPELPDNGNTARLPFLARRVLLPLDAIPLDRFCLHRIQQHRANPLAPAFLTDEKF